MASFLQSYKGKKIFLTGHTGFKGSWMAQWLISLGAKVSGFSDEVPTKPSHFEVLKLHGQLEDFRGDVNDLSTLKKALKSSQPDMVFHMAAQPLVRASYDNPIETFSTNAMGTANILEAIRGVDSVQAAVMITTDKVYENTGQAEPYLEIDHLGGHDPYSASKAAAEIIASSYIRSFFAKGPRIAIARAGNVIGGGDWAEDRLIPDCARAWGGGQKKVLIRNPRSVRPWQHVLEPVGAYLLLGHYLLHKPEIAHGQAFNFGPGMDLNRNTLDLVLEMEKSWPGVNHEIAVQSAADLAKKEAHTLRLNCDKAAKVLGWKARLNFEETISWTSAWYRNFYENPAAAAELTKSQIYKFEKALAASE